MKYSKNTTISDTKMNRHTEKRRNKMREEKGCRKRLHNLTAEKCDECYLGPCYGHDCTLGNHMVNWMFFGFVGPPQKKNGHWYVEFKKHKK